MKIENNGSLTLFVCDLLPDHADVAEPTLRQFSNDVQIAAAYANLAGFSVTFVRPGQLLVPITGNSYFKPRKVSPCKQPKPVPKSAIGKCVGHFPAMKIYRKVPGIDVGEGKTPDFWCVAHPATTIEKGDLWK